VDAPSAADTVRAEDPVSAGFPVAPADRASSANSSSRLSTTPAAKTSKAVALMPIATYTSNRLLVATPAMSTPIATTTSAALNRITLHLLVCPGAPPEVSRRVAGLPAVVNRRAAPDREATRVLHNRLRAGELAWTLLAAVAERGLPKAGR
jgi:hypothetical protein